MAANMNEQQKARIASMMKTWERRKKIGHHLSQIRSRIGVYSGKGGVGKTTVTFSEPGDYVLLVQSIETLRNSFEYHCCWTNGWVEVTVTN